MSLKLGQITMKQMVDELNRISENTFTTDMIVQTIGQSTTDVMSQKAITDLLEDANATFARKDGEYVDMVVGKAVMASVDGGGHDIESTYAKKKELPTIAQETGASETSVMSQKAATDNFALKSSVPPIVQYVGDSTTSVMSQSGVKNALLSFLPVDGSDLKVGLTKTSLVSGMTYLDCKITATVSSGTYYFYNCTGTVTVSGTSAKIYASNCPNLTITGKTASNWKNIWVDGVANSADGIVTQYSNGIMIISETTYPNTSGTIQYTFPVAFSAEPATTLTGLFGSRYITSEQQTATYIKYTVWDQDGQTNAQFTNIHAIGRWK